MGILYFDSFLDVDELCLDIFTILQCFLARELLKMTIVIIKTIYLPFHDKDSKERNCLRAVKEAKPHYTPQYCVLIASFGRLLLFCRKMFPVTIMWISMTAADCKS